ncbi:MAG: FHA domain-containing protein [Deltaproteobacteria bacterium]|nr:FHA domain-containing protein [Deltaproteobacteria bacterium]
MGNLVGPCISCGHENEAGKTYCEMCGARLQTGAIEDDGDDLLEDSLSLMLGLVCGKCDSYNDPGSSHCVSCGTSIVDPTAQPPAAQTPAAQTPAAQTPAAPTPAAPTPAAPTGAAAPAWMSAPAGSPLATVNAMKAVDLSTLKAESSGLVAPSNRISTPPSNEMPVTAVVEPNVVAAPVVSAPVVAAPVVAAPVGRSPIAPATRACEKCSGEILVDDIFCKLCGQKQGQDQATAAGTLMMRAAAIPDAAAPAPSTNSTMMMPSLNIGPAGSPAGIPAPAAGGMLAPKGATAFFGAVSVDRFARLLLVKGHTQYGTQWRLQAGKTAIGHSLGAVLFPNDPFLASLHCELEFRGGDLWLLPQPSINGVFLKMVPGSKEKLQGRDEFVVGTQRMRVLADDDRATVLPAADAHGTQLAAGIKRAKLPILVQRVGTRASMDETYARPQRLLTMGRAQADVNFPTDPYISTRHAQLSRHDDGSYELHDLNSRNGTFVRVQKERKLEHGAQLMMGEQVMRVELNTLPQIGYRN